MSDEEEDPDEEKEREERAVMEEDDLLCSYRNLNSRTPKCNELSCVETMGLWFCKKHAAEFIAISKALNKIE